MATTGWFLLAARERASLLLTEWRSHAPESSLFRLLLLLLLLARERLRHVPGRAGAGESSGAELSFNEVERFNVKKKTMLKLQNFFKSQNVKPGQQNNDDDFVHLYASAAGALFQLVKLKSINNLFMT